MKSNSILTSIILTSMLAVFAYADTSTYTVIIDTFVPTPSIVKPFIPPRYPDIVGKYTKNKKLIKIQAELDRLTSEYYCDMYFRRTDKPFQRRLKYEEKRDKLNRKRIEELKKIYDKEK